MYLEQPPFFKEYSCHYFAVTRKIQAKIRFKYDVLLANSNTKIQLPSAIIDHFRQQDQIYLLQWKQHSNGLTLLVRAAQQTDWVQINLTSSPIELIITDNHLFILSKKELYILNLLVYEPYHCNKIEDQIIDAQISCNEKGESGIVIVLYNQYQHYFTHFYSKSQHPKSWNKIVQYFNIFSTQQPRPLKFKSILPNLMAICFNSDEQISLYNLFKMNRLQHTKIQLNSWKIDFNQQIKIDWCWEETTNQEWQDLNLAIGQGFQIEIFTIRLYKSKQSQKNIKIADVIRGNVIDWEQVLITSKVMLHLEHSLKTIRFIKEGLAFATVTDDNYSPTIQIANLNFSCQFSSVITLQYGIWRQYQKDLLNKDQIDTNRWFIPNRYTPQLINLEITNPKQTLSHHIHLQLVNQWRKQSEFVNLLFYRNQLIISRRGSLTVLAEIPQNQYEMERNHVEKSQSIKPYFQTEGVLSDEQISGICEAIIDSFYERQQIQSNEKQQLPSLFQQQIDINTIKDTINYYQILFNRYSFISQNKHKAFSTKNQFVIKLFHYFAKMNQHSAHYYSVYNTDLISLFYKKCCVSLQDFFIKITKGLLPDIKIPGKPVYKFQNQENPFIQFLLHQWTDSENENKNQLIRNQFINIHQINFYQSKSRQFSKYWQSSTLLLSYLITTNNQNLVKSVLSNVILNHRSLKQDFYKDIQIARKYIPQKWQTIEQLALKNDSLRLFAFQNSFFDQKQEVNWNQNNPDSTIGFKILKNIIQRQILLNSQRLNFEQSKIKIENLLDSLQQNHESHLKTKLIEIYNQIQKQQIRLKNYAHILELDEVVLRKLSKIAQDKCKQSYKWGLNPSVFSEQSLILKEYLRLIEVTFINFKKYFNKLYGKSNYYQDRSSSKLLDFNRISDIFIDQQITISDFLDEPIKILNIPVSPMLIVVFKRSIQISKSFCQYHKFEHIGEHVMTKIINDQGEQFEDFLLLQYLYLKMGQKITQNILINIPLQAIENTFNKITSHDQRFTIINVFAGMIHSEESLKQKKFINPYIFATKANY